MFKNYIFQHPILLVYIYIYRLEIRQITNTQTWINISNFSKKQSFQKKKEKCSTLYPNNYKERKTLESLASTKEVPASNQKHRTQSAMDVSSPALPVITDNFPVV